MNEVEKAKSPQETHSWERDKKTTSTVLLKNPNKKQSQAARGSGVVGTQKLGLQHGVEKTSFVFLGNIFLF